MKRILLLLLPLFALAGSANAFTTVIIDAGHGGKDPGGIPFNLACEKTLALDVAGRLGEIMREEGIRTIMTRTNDTFIPLPARVAVANAHPGALFVSIHFNSGLRRGANGFETFYYNPKSAPIATRVYSELERMNPGERRGVKRRALYVLRKTRGAAVLVECGFLTNPQETALCLTPAYREKLARAIAKAITDGQLASSKDSEPAKKNDTKDHSG
ncbi:MAG: N-acetylmuramoyl-L-alanine amidase [Chthoniobacteraceae bacterium]